MIRKRHVRGALLARRMPVPAEGGTRRLVRVGLYLLLCLGSLGPAGFGGDGDKDKKKAEVPEYYLKAQVLSSIAGFITWPKESFKDKRSPFVVAVVGKDPFGKHLDVIFDKVKVKSRSVKLVRFKKIEDIGLCHILFVPTAEVPKIAAIQKQLGKQHVLIVGDTKGFALKGACINFFPDKKKLGFEVNLKAAERAELKISSHLLRSAVIVKEKKGDEKKGVEKKGVEKKGVEKKGVEKKGVEAGKAPPLRQAEGGKR